MLGQAEGSARTGSSMRAFSPARKFTGKLETFADYVEIPARIFAVAGCLAFDIRLTPVRRTEHMQSSAAYRFGVGLALTAAFLIVWLNAAAGLIGIEDDDPANLLYAGVLAIGLVGALIARFQPRGLSRALFATALAQALVGVIALRLPNTAGSAQIVILHGVFVALFAGAALLFRRAARSGFSPRTGATG